MYVVLYTCRPSKVKAKIPGTWYMLAVFIYPGTQVCIYTININTLLFVVLTL